MADKNKKDFSLTFLKRVIYSKRRDRIGKVESDFRQWNAGKKEETKNA